jgi:hypothetical protein
VGETSSFHTAATIRFNTANGRIEARSGSTYPATSLAWSAGQTYRFRIVVDVPSHTYAAYVTAPGGSEQTIGTGLAFRSNYASASSLNNLRGAVDGGSIEVCPVGLPTGGGGGGSGVDVYLDQQDVTFTSGTPGVQAAVVAGEGVRGSYAVKHTSLTQWGSSRRLHFATPIDISQVLGTDKLRISLDLSAGGPANNNIYVHFNNDWQVYVMAPAIDSVPGYQTYTLDLGPVRSQLGNAVNDIYFKAGNGFPVNGTLWVDEIRFVRP